MSYDTSATIDGKRQVADGNLQSPISSLDAVFLVWGPPSHGPRSRVFARELGIKQLHFVYSTLRRGLLAAPLKYTYQTVATLRLLWRLRPRVIFVQSPPSLAVLVVYLYSLIGHSQYIVDAHSDAFHSPFWSRPRWLHRFLACKAVTTIVTNEHFQQRLESWGARAFILRDIPTKFPQQGGFPVEGQFNVVVVNTFADDEPLEQVLHAAEQLDSTAERPIHFYITGKTSRAPQNIAASIAQPAQLPHNVHFTDFLPDADYYALMNSADAIMCLTTRDHTMQRGACEALSLGKPIITSDWPLLKTYFHRGAVHVDNTARGIRAGVHELFGQHDYYKDEIKALQKDQMQEWHDKIELLTRLIQFALNGDGKAGGRE